MGPRPWGLGFSGSGKIVSGLQHVTLGVTSIPVVIEKSGLSKNRVFNIKNPTTQRIRIKPSFIEERTWLSPFLVDGTPEGLKLRLSGVP